MAIAGGIAAAAAAAFSNAIKASGVIVEHPLVIYAESGFFSTDHQYLVSYKGFAFVTTSSEPISPPADAETILVERIWIPK
jgi:hypothetical protein